MLLNQHAKRQLKQREKTARLEQKSGMVWPAELDLYMSDQGYTAIDVPGDTKTFPHTEIRNDLLP